MLNSMKTIGLVGGISWHSTLEYYKIINEAVNKQLGNHHSADIILRSINFEEVLQYWNTNKLADAVQVLVNAVDMLEKAGADFFMICSNAAHKIADEITTQAKLPFLDIRASLVSVLKLKNIKKVAVIGTKVTMQSDFYHDYLQKNNIDSICPSEADIVRIDKLIFSYIKTQLISDDEKFMLASIINKLTSQRIDGVVLACTELPIMLHNVTFPIELFDTVKIHANDAVKKSLASC